MTKNSFIVGLIALAAASAASLYAAAPAGPAAAPPAAPGAGAAPAATAPAAPAGRRGNRGAGGGGGRRGAAANLGPAPEMPAPVANTLPGLLGKPLKWVSTGPLVVPQNDPTHFLFSIKDPTVAFIDGKWEIYATANMVMGANAGATPPPTRGGTFNMVHLSFKDWKDAPAQKLFYMDQAGFTGYKCAPELFQFSGDKKWYFIYQTQPPVYRTSVTPGDPKSWSEPQPFFAQGTPIPGNPGIDFHIIGDGTHMFLFFTGDDGNVYRSQTTYAEFPKGFTAPAWAIAGTRNAVFEAGFAYKIKGTDKYLFTVEGLGAGRYYSAYVADKLDGVWSPIEGFNTPEKPFAGRANMTFEPGAPAWSTQVSHGEMLRDGYDEKQILDPNNLQFLYQGMDDAQGRGVDYGSLPYKLGLLRAVKE